MKSKYFKIQEFVTPDVYNKYGEKAWEFIDDRLVLTMDSLRELFNAPITINNWLWGGNLTQRGLRANKDPMVVEKKDYYISQHCLGRAVDFNVKGYTAQEVYSKILAEQGKLPYITRIENIASTPTWVHIDLANIQSSRGDDIYIFRP